MAEYNQQEAQRYQDDLVQRSLQSYRTLGREVVDYYTTDRVDDEADARENLRGMRKWLRYVCDDLNKIVDSIDYKIGGQ